MPPPAVDQQVTFLYCQELDASTKFYREVIGLTPVLDQGTCQLFHVAGEAFLGLCRCRGAEKVSRDGVTFTLVSEDVDGWYRHLRKHDVETLAPPRARPAFQIYNFFARDPEGHLLEFQRFLSPEWPKPGSL